MSAPVSIPVAYCWTCKEDVVVWRDFSDDFTVEWPRCTQCDTVLNQWGVDPGIRNRPLTHLETLGLDVTDVSGGQACGSGGSGGGCGSPGGCGGGGGCWTPATEGRAGEMAASGERGCGSCGIKTACAAGKREKRQVKSTWNTPLESAFKILN